MRMRAEAASAALVVFDGGAEGVSALKLGEVAGLVGDELGGAEVVAVEEAAGFDGGALLLLAVDLGDLAGAGEDSVVVAGDADAGLGLALAFVVVANVDALVARGVGVGVAIADLEQNALFVGVVFVLHLGRRGARAEGDLGRLVERVVF